MRNWKLLHKQQSDGLLISVETYLELTDNIFFTLEGLTPEDVNKNQRITFEITVPDLMGILCEAERYENEFAND